MYEPEDEDEEIPFEFANPKEFYKEWYGADTDEELYDAMESDCSDD